MFIMDSILSNAKEFRGNIKGRRSKEIKDYLLRWPQNIS